MFIVPSIYTAVDRYSTPLRGMASATHQFEQRLHSLGAGSERAFRRHTNVFSNTTQGMFEYAQSMVVAGAAIGAVLGTGAAISNYNKQLASFRTIVSDLNDVEFGAYKKEIADVAFATRKNTIIVAESFESIAGLNSKYAETADGLGMVSAASITLAKAANMELRPAAESTVSIMNQYSFAANQANRTINVLAAGQAVGAASISQTADAMTNFGATAAGANVTLEQSVALIQVLAKYGQQGADAGHRLRSSLVKIQETGMGYKSGRFDIGEALEGIKAKYDALGTAQAKDAYLTKVFGLEQITAGRILVSNIALWKEYTGAVTGTNEAQRAAAINSATLSTRIDEMKDKWINLVTTTAAANFGLNAVSGAIGFLTDHMGGILSVAVPFLGFFAAWKTLLLANTALVWGLGKATAVMNFILGVGTVITGKYATACFASAAGMRGMAFASFFLERGLMGSLGIIGAAAAAIMIIANNFSYASDKARYLRGELQLTKDGFAEVKRPITEAAIALDQYTEALKKYETEKRGHAYDQYMAKHHPGKYMVKELFEWKGFGGDLKPSVPMAPSQSDFPGLDTSVNNRPFLDSLRNSYEPAKDTVVNLTVNVDKQGNVDVSGGGNVRVNGGPSLGKTGAYGGR